MKENPDDIVFLCTYFGNITDAHIARDILEAHGVPCMIYNETLSSVEWGGWALPQLMVFRRDVEIAKNILIEALGDK